MQKNTPIAPDVLANTKLIESALIQVVEANNAIKDSIGQLTSTILSNQAPLQQAADQISKPFSLALGTIDALPLRAQLAVSAVEGVGTLIASSVQAFDQYEVRQLQLQNTLQATGQASGLTATQLQEHAQQVALGTAASLSEVQQAQIQLTQYVGIQGENFKRTLELAQNLSASFDWVGSTSDGVKLLGTALMSPVEGIKRLQAAGVQFTEQQQSVITSLATTGKTAEAQKALLDALDGSIGEAGESITTLSGAAANLKDNWDGLLGAIGQTGVISKGIVAPLKGVVNSVSGLFDGLRKSIAPTVSDIEGDIAELQQKIDQPIKPRRGRSGLSEDVQRQQKEKLQAEQQELQRKLLISKAEAGNLDANRELLAIREQELAAAKARIKDISAGDGSNKNRSLKNARRELGKLEAERDKVAKGLADAEQRQAQSQRTQASLQSLGKTSNRPQPSSPAVPLSQPLAAPVVNLDGLKVECCEPASDAVASTAEPIPTSPVHDLPPVVSSNPVLFAPLDSRSIFPGESGGIPDNPADLSGNGMDSKQLLSEKELLYRTLEGLHLNHWLNLEAIDLEHEEKKRANLGAQDLLAGVGFNPTQSLSEMGIFYEALQALHQEHWFNLETIDLEQEELKRVKREEQRENMLLDLFFELEQRRFIQQEHDLLLEEDKLLHDNNLAKSTQDRQQQEVSGEQSKENLLLAGIDRFNVLRNSKDARQRAVIGAGLKLATRVFKGEKLKEAFIDSKGAILKAFNSAPPPLNFVLAAATAATTLPIVSEIAGFEGGGFVPPGLRIGGIDGRGGKLAVLHPNEAVYDYTRNSAPVTSSNNSRISQNFNIDIGGGGSTEELREELVPMIRQAAMDGARMGADMGYERVGQDFEQSGPIRQQLAI